MQEVENKYPGKVLEVYDNLFTYHEMRHYSQFFPNSAFRVSGGDNIALNGRQEQIYARYEPTEIEKLGFSTHPKIKEISIKHNLINRDIFQMRCNLTTNSEKNFIHTDSYGITLLYYANLEWKLEWGGHTLFMDDNLSEAKYVCLYKPGRLVVFDGSIPHMIMSPTNLCPVNRFSFAIHLGPVRGE